MVWKIRSKTAYIFEKGTQRYTEGPFKNFNIQNIKEFPMLIVTSDRMTPVRIAHNYRNISRASKQFLLGDPYAEQLMVLILRNEFYWPIKNTRSPIYNYKPMARLMGDHTDRHYGLIANNHHPLQLYLYEHLNKLYRKHHNFKLAQQGKGELTFDVAIKKKVEELIEGKLKTLDVENGEDISPDDLWDIHTQADREVRAMMGLVMKTRNKRGEVEDYLEVRRPFGAESAKH